MAGVGTLTISGTVIGFSTGSRVVNLPIELTAAVDASDSVVLATGYNAITVPGGAKLCIIKPPSANTIGMTLKGPTGDTGFALHPSTPSLISLASGAVLGITAAGPFTDPTEFLFF